MSKDITIFNNELFGSVRTMMIDDNPWFFGKDIAEALGYGNLSDALKKHVDEEDKLQIAKRDLQNCDDIGTKGAVIINESGMYSLVFGSKKPEAKAFKKWVTSDVLPQLRMSGVYITESASQESIDYQSLYGKNRIYNTFMNSVDLEAEYKRFYEMSKAERKARHINNDIRIECSKIIQKAITDRIANSLTDVPASKLLAMRELSEQIQVDITKLSNKANGGFKANMTKKIRTQQQQLEFMETELIEVRSQYNELEHEYEEYRNIQEQGEDAELIEIEYFGFSNNDMYDYIDGKVRRTYKYNSWINRFPVHTIDTLSEDVDFDKPMACELYFDHGARFDVHNFIKPMLDMIARANGKDDKNIRKVSCVTNEIVNDHYKDGRIYLKLYNIELD
jgi:prophage antirepressor-like protein